MVNVYDFMKDLPPTKRLAVNDLLFAEYKCPLSETCFDMWTHHNYFVYVIKGKKKWFSGGHEVLARAEDVFPLPDELHDHQFFPAKDMSRAGGLYEALG
jgi:AraC family transcriptional regulator, exoenzyme S synthesis regulatory protein ExsA